MRDAAVNDDLRELPGVGGGVAMGRTPELIVTLLGILRRVTRTADGRRLCRARGRRKIPTRPRLRAPEKP